MSVKVRTTLVLARFRYHLRIGGTAGEAILCEEIVPLAFAGTTASPQWLGSEESEHLLAAKAERNLLATAIEQQRCYARSSLRSKGRSAGLPRIEPPRNFRRTSGFREAAETRGRMTIEPVLPVDILGAYVLLPANLE